MRPHAYRKLGRIPWLVCAHCGLVLMRHKAARKADRAECPGKNLRLSGSDAAKAWAAIPKDWLAD